MVDWVVDEVQGRLAVEEDSNRGGDSRLSLHPELELSKEVGLLPSHGKRHVLAFARAQAGIPNHFLLLNDGSYSRQEDESCTRAASVGTGKVARIAAVNPFLLHEAPRHHPGLVLFDGSREAFLLLEDPLAGDDWF